MLGALARLFVGSTLALAAVVPVRAQESLPSTLEALRAREVECESRLQAIYRQRSESVTKVYPSAEAKAGEWRQLEAARQREQACLTEIDDALVQTLTAQEAGCRKSRCATDARQERIVRQQLRGFRTQQYACEQQTSRFEELLRAQGTTTPVAPEGATPGRTYRDQVVETRALEQARDRSLACARQAAMQQGHLKASLGISPAGAPASDEAFERDSAALLELIRTAGEGASTWSYEVFARAIETLRGRLAAYHQAHQALIAHNPGAPARLVAAAEALFSVADAWASELRAGRDAARFKADLEAGLRRDASPSARVSVAESRRGLVTATDAQAAAARARTDALSRMQSSLAGLQTTDIPRTGAR